RLYHTFAFHLSLILRAAARDFFSAMQTARRGVAYLRVQQGRGGTLDLTDSTASSLAPVRGDAGSRRWRATRPAPIALVSRSLGRDGRSLKTESRGGEKTSGSALFNADGKRNNAVLAEEF